MTKKLTAIFLALLLTVSGMTALRFVSAAETGVSAQYAQDTVDGGAILHCFNWSYNNIRAKLSEIREAGYTAVQTSPVQPPKDYNSSWTDLSGQWWKLYQPLGLRVADGNSWLGTKAQLRSLCEEAENYGIKVIVDIVSNHLANNGTDGGTFANLNTGVDSDLQQSAYYHSESSYISDNSRYTITQYHLNMPDLNTANSTVQSKTLSLLKECVDLGVDGFRFDAAKHIELPTDDSSCRSNFWPNVLGGVNSYQSGLFHYGEILGGAGTDISNYTAYMSITDNYTGDKSLYAANTQNCAGLADCNYYKGATPDKSVLWVESHDTYMGSSGSGGYTNTSGVSGTAIARAWAITGSRADATTLFFARPQGTMGAASSDETWKSTAVAEVNKFKNFFDGTSEYLASNSTYSATYNERGTKGVVISKLNGGGYVSLTANRMAAGTYTDQVSGNTFTVANGKISGTVGSTGVAVVYNPGESPTETTVADTRDYYLFGWIGGSNYACDDDWQNLGIYHFTNGQLTATFTQDAYIGVKALDSSNNLSWYMTDGWLGTSVTSATLYNTSSLSNANKLYVPANKTLYFSLSYDSSSDSVQISYSETAPTTVAPTTAEPTTEEPTTAEPTTEPREPDYYLFGTINGQDYACEDDWQNPGDYHFVNGQLTATFTQDSYVAVKSVDANDGNFMRWYMTDGWLGTSVTSATLYNTDAGINADKLFVPAGREAVFTLTVNAADDTLQLSYTLAPEPTTEEPTTEEPTTEEPTTEEPTTEEPTTEEPTTEEPTTEEPTTEEPTTEEPTTEEPTTEEPTTEEPTTEEPTTEAPTTEAPTTTAPPNPVVNITLGDVDGDGVINIADATLVQMYLADYLTFTRVQKIAADVNNDGSVTVKDVTCLQRYLIDDGSTGYAGNITQIPENFTLVLTNSLGWSGKIRCYYWADADNGMVEWPGETMTYLNTNGYGQQLYSITLPYTVEYAIFTNGSDQTENIRLTGTDTRYYVTGDTTAYASYIVATW